MASASGSGLKSDDGPQGGVGDAAAEEPGLGVVSRIDHLEVAVEAEAVLLAAVVEVDQVSDLDVGKC